MEEPEVRAIARLLQEARLPRMKTLDLFEFDRSGVEASQLRTLAEGDYIARAEPILLVGEAGTGKTRLATGLCVAPCRQRRGFASPPRRRWLTSWSKPLTPTNSVAPSDAGSGWT